MENLFLITVSSKLGVEVVELDEVVDEGRGYVRPLL